MHVTAILLAAGQGIRFSGRVPKLLVKVRAHPVIAYSLATLDANNDIDEIILVVNARNRRQLIGVAAQYRIKKISAVVVGGRLRQDSVRNGLEAISGATDLVLIHDGARPFVDKETISRAIDSAKKHGASVVGVPVKATIKEAVKTQAGKSVKTQVLVKKTLNRDILWEIQTPQVFKKKLILEAYRKFSGCEVTDDAALVEKTGAQVELVLGSYYNIKVTTPEDLLLAQAIAKKGRGVR